MADLATVEAAFLAADRAGDTQAAAALAGEVRRLRSQSATPAPKPQLGSMADQIPGVLPQKQAPQTTAAEDIAANPITRFAMATGRPVLALGEFLPDALGGGAIRRNNQQLDEIIRRGKQGQSDTMQTVGEVADVAGTVLSPAMIKVAKALAPVKDAGYWAKTGLGIATGGTMAGLEPVKGEGNFWEKKGEQVGTGVVLGGLISGVAEPVASAGWGLIKKTITPSVEKFRTDAARDYLRKEIGDEGVDFAINAIKNKKEIVPGSQVTVADAIAEANRSGTRKGASSLVAIQDQLEKMAGGVSDTAKTIRATQSEARNAAIKSVQPELAFEEGARRAASKPLYEAAESAGNVVDVAPVVSKIDDLLARKGGNPELSRELTKIREGIVSSGSDIGFGPRMGAANAERLTSVIDGIKAAKKNKENSYILTQLIGIQDDLAKAIPSYDAAQQAFSSRSAGVNQNKVLQAMLDKLERPGGMESVQPFLNVLGKGEQALLKRSTGFPRYEAGDLNKVLNPDQMSAVNKVASELSRNIERTNIGKDVNVQRLFDIAEDGSLKWPQLWSRPSSIAHWLMRQFGNDADQMIAKDMANLMLTNPAAFSQKYLEQLPPKARSQIVNALSTSAKINIPLAATNGASQ